MVFSDKMKDNKALNDGASKKITIKPPLSLNKKCNNQRDGKTDESAHDETRFTAEKVKRMETKLEDILKQINKDSNNPDEMVGGFEEKVTLIQKIIGEQASTKTINSEKGKKDQIMTNASDDKPVKNKQRSENRQYLIPTNTQEESYTRYYQLIFSETAKRSVNPYEIIRKIESTTGYKPKELTGYNRTSFSIEMRNKTQSQLITNITDVSGHKCEMKIHPQFNVCNTLR